MTTSVATFTSAQQAAIEILRRSLSQHTRNLVTTEYGSDDGQHWAALMVDSLPVGSFGRPGALVSVLVGEGVSGPSAVMANDGTPLAEGLDFTHALQVARFAGVKEYRAMCEGAFH